MATPFKNLFNWVLSGGKTPPPSHHVVSTQRERARRTAADESTSHAARRESADVPASLTSIKARIAEESAKILADLHQQTAAELAQQRADALKRQAEQEARIEASKPENRFLAGERLTLNVDFRSSNPPKPAVYQVWYVAKEQAMYVRFWENGPGRTYKYWTVTRTEAMEMYVASSKGIHIWDQYRVRGSRVLHKKSYAQVG